MFLLLTFLPSILWAQECYCAKNAMMTLQQKNPQIIYTFSNKHKIGLCGEYEIENLDTIYSEFSIYECGKDDPINEWGAMESCKVSQKDDTLLVSDIYMLPVGDNFIFLPISFYIHRFFYKGDSLIEQAYYRNDIKKYTKSQRKSVIEQYKTLRRGNYDTTMHVANKLFWGYVSGSKKAERLLLKIENKFGPFDGGISEEWNEIISTYEHWKDLNKKTKVN